jgi:hypothetical protein
MDSQFRPYVKVVVLLGEGDVRNSLGIAQTASSVQANCLWVQKYA